VVSPFLYILTSGTPNPVPDDEITIARVLLGVRGRCRRLLALDWIRAHWKRRSDRLIAANICTNCAYNLTANTSGVCPECGTAVSKKRRQLCDATPSVHFHVCCIAAALRPHDGGLGAELLIADVVTKESIRTGRWAVARSRAQSACASVMPGTGFSSTENLCMPRFTIRELLIQLSSGLDACLGRFR